MIKGKPSGVLQSVASGFTKALRTVKLIGDDKPEGLPWKNKDPRKDYRFGNELGHGNYGVVHSVTHIGTGKVFACKILRDDASATQRKHLLAEVSSLFRVRKHPNIVTLHEVYEDGGYIYLMMEACLGGELFDVIMHRGHFSERDAATVLKVVLDVVAYCHKEGVAHRDLKPENFLLKRKALDANIPLTASDLRAVDFGLAVFLRPGQHLKELLGSPFYIAPELLQGTYSYPADCWSAGIILYILLSGLPPFCGRNEKEVFRRVLRQPLDLDSAPWPTVSDQAKDLVKKLLERDPTKRLTAEAALKHEWLQMKAVPDSKEQSKIVLTRLREFAQITKLQGLLMNLIAKNMSLEDIDALRDAFNQLDSDGDGYLSFDELRQALEKDSEDGNDPAIAKVADAAMHALDVSGDGFIEYHEFLAAAIDRQRIVTDHTLAELFTYLDKNGDGLISPAELRLALKEADIEVPEDQLKELMQETLCKRDGSADNPVLSEKLFTELMLQGMDTQVIEFTQLESALSDMQYEFRQKNRFRQLALLVIARHMPKSELEGLEELFSRLDVDHDGQLSVNELRKGLQHMDSGLKEEDIEELVESMDVDGNELIDLHEFVMGLMEDKQLLTEAKLRAAFDYFDKDRNGAIDLSEVQQAVDELGIRLSQSPKELLALADANDDQEVDFMEFREMMLQAEPNVLINRHISLVGRDPATDQAASAACAFADGSPAAKSTPSKPAAAPLQSELPLAGGTQDPAQKDSPEPRASNDSSPQPPPTPPADSEPVRVVAGQSIPSPKSVFDDDCPEPQDATSKPALNQEREARLSRNGTVVNEECQKLQQERLSDGNDELDSTSPSTSRSASLSKHRQSPSLRSCLRRTTDESVPGSLSAASSRRRSNLVYMGGSIRPLVSFSTPDNAALDRMIEEASGRTDVQQDNTDDDTGNSVNSKQLDQRSKSDGCSNRSNFAKESKDTTRENSEDQVVERSLKSAPGNLRAMLTAMDDQWSHANVINN